MASRDRQDESDVTLRRSVAMRLLALGQQGWEELAQHIVKIYTGPLTGYFKYKRQQKPRLRKLGEPGDVVSDFFTYWLTTQRLVRKWIALDPPRRLRYYLLTSLVDHFCNEELRKLRRDEVRKKELKTTAETEAELLAQLRELAAEPIDEVLADQLFTPHAIANAAQEARQALSERDLGDHWRVLVAHYWEERPYAEIADELGRREDEDYVRAKMAPRARAAFRTRFEEILERDGLTPDQIKDEIHRLRKHCTDAQVRRILGLVLEDSPDDTLTERLRAERGAEQLLLRLARALGVSLSALEAQLVQGGASLEEMKRHKGQAKALFARDDEEAQAAGRLGYYLTTAAAWRHHREWIASQTLEQLRPLASALPSLLPGTWGELAAAICD